jgi:hypothetical protein
MEFLRLHANLVDRDDGVVAPHPPIYDALRKLQHNLVASGHDVIDWEPVDHQGAWDLIVSVVSHIFLER